MQNIYKDYGIRELRRQDLSLIKDWRNKQMDILRQNQKLTNDDQDRYWERISFGNQERLLAIVDETGDLIGYGGLVHVDYVSQKGEISFLLDPKLSESDEEFLGIFTGFVKHMLNVGFGDMNMNRVVTETYVFRKRIILALEKIGFRKEGVLRENVYKKGHYYDSVLHAMLRREYEGCAD